MSKIRLVVKPTSGNVKYSVGAEPAWTVAELKEDVARQAGTSASDLKLIYKGKILKDGETVEGLGLENDHVIHMVKSKAAGSAGASASIQAASAPIGATPAAEPSPLGDIPGMGPGALGAGFAGGFGSPEQLAAMMNTPMMQSILDNPEIMRTMLQSNATVRQLMESNPELGHILNNPELLRESLQVAGNPGLQLEQMRSQDRALSNIEAHPEGFNALRRMYETIQEPLMNATTSEAAAASNPFAALFQGAGATAPGPAAAPAAPAGIPNNQPLPNPWAAPAAGAGGAAAGLGGLAGMNPMAGLGGLPGLGAGGVGGSGPFGGMDPNAMMQMMQTPAMQQFVSSMLSQPGYMEAALSANPQMQQMLEQEPQMRELLRNPDMMRRMLDPSNIQAMAQMRQAMDQLSAAGLGPNLGGLGGAGLGGGGLGDLSGLLGGLPTVVPPVANPTEVYANELQQLVEMGFIDEQANINALQATGGNVSAAVARLCEQGNLPP